MLIMASSPGTNLRGWPLLIWVPLAGAAVCVALSAPLAVTALVSGVLGIACTLLLWRRVIAPRAHDQASILGRALGLAARFDPEHAPPASAGLPEIAASLASVVGAVDRRVSDLDRQLRNARQVLDAAPWPMLATNGEGVVVVFNHAALDFFQRSNGLAGRVMEELITQREVLTLHAAALQGQEGHGQVRLQRHDGVRIYEVRTAPVRLMQDKEQTGAVVSLRDITELATALQLKTDFVANASHELRTPLASIKAAAETLSDGGWDDGAMRAKLVQMISGNVGRLEEMVRDLLDLSRLESAEAPVHIAPVSLQEVAAGLQEEFETLAKARDLTLSFEIDPQAEHLRTDPKLLTLILKNLIDNATKFANEGTTVRIVAAPGAGAAGTRIQVIDRGMGIPLAQQQRVFERFFQVDPARTGFAHRRGTGLGLAIVKHAVKAIGGTIGVESVWKEGTTMTVDLPDEPAQGGSRISA
jgi:two-component system phosphate regulon sensor histidine kinase PhoR